MLQRKYVTASKSEHQGVAWLLLEREDTNSGAADTKYNQTLLYWAENGGSSRVVVGIGGFQSQYSRHSVWPNAPCAGR